MDVEESLPRLLSERYRLEAELGHGGMGVVYRATDLMMKRAVAVKLIRASDGSALDEEVAGRFLREAKNTARIQHENIVEVYDLGRSKSGDLYMVMELLEGESLSVRLRREGPLAPALAVHIGRQICDALEVAHQAGIVHRDLKPANIMLLRRAGHDAFVKVLDFGVAKSTSGDQTTQLTHTGMLVGTVEYMAPEQIMGKTVDGRTDIYSLGIMLYRMLLGRPPFKDASVPAMIHHHLNVMPKPLHELVADIPGELDRVVLRCLAKLPERRYESMAELARALASATRIEGHVDAGDDAPEDDPYAGETRVAGAPGAGAGGLGAVSTVPPPGNPRAPMGPLPAPAPLPTARAAHPRAPTGPQAPARSSIPSVPNNPELGDEPFDDATIRIDRSGPEGPRHAPAQAVPRPAAGMPFDATAVLARGSEIARPDGLRTCGNCHAVNGPHGHSCVGCGAPLGVAHGAPHMLAGATHQPIRHGSFPHTPAHGVAANGWGAFGAPRQLPHAPPPAPPSIWERFLTWTGLRGR